MARPNSFFAGKKALPTSICSAVLELEDWEKAFSMAENKEGYKILFQLHPEE